jgi:hypothetical protein
MTGLGLKYTATFSFASSVPECLPRPAVYNSFGWPEEPERSSRLIIFTDDSCHGAFLAGAKDVILFSVSHRNGSHVKQRSDKFTF